MDDVDNVDQLHAERGLSEKGRFIKVEVLRSWTPSPFLIFRGFHAASWAAPSAYATFTTPPQSDRESKIVG